MPSVLTLGGTRFHTPWAEGGFSNRTSFSLSSPVTVVTLLEISPRTPLLLCLSGGVASRSSDSERPDLVYSRPIKCQDSVGLTVGGFLSFSVHSVTISIRSRKCVEVTPKRLLRRSFPQVLHGPPFSEGSTESELWVRRNADFTRSMEIFVRGT